MLPRAAQPSRSPSPAANRAGTLDTAHSRPATPPRPAGAALGLGSALTGLLSIASLPTGAATLDSTQETVVRVAADIRSAVSSAQPYVLPAGQHLFPREFAWPLPSDFEWPVFGHFAFHEHSGAFREAWPDASCSVADRPTNVPPSEGKFHFCMNVGVFLAVYPHPVGTQTSGVTCTFSTWANHANWRSFVLSGELFEKADEFLFMLYIGARAAGETPPSCFEAIIGPPSFVTSNYLHGPADDSETTSWKTVEWYTRNLPVVPPSHRVPDHLQRPRPSHANSDVSMVLRSTMSPSFAEAHTACWGADPAAAPDAGRPAWMVAPGYADHRRLMVCNFAAFAAQFTPMVTVAELLRSDRAPLLVAVPIGMGDELCALIPLKHACFAIPLRAGVPLLEQMQTLITFLPQHEQPQQMHVTRDKHGDVIFALPFVERVVGAAATLSDLPRRRNLRAAWAVYAALTPGQFEHTALAMERCRSFVTAVPWMRANVGVTDGPVPVTPHRASAAYRGGHGQATALTEWQAFLLNEQAHHRAIHEAFEAEDGGTGILAPFIGNINTAATRAVELCRPRRACLGWTQQLTACSRTPTRRCHCTPRTSRVSHRNAYRTVSLTTSSTRRSSAVGLGGRSPPPST